MEELVRAELNYAIDRDIRTYSCIDFPTHVVTAYPQRADEFGSPLVDVVEAMAADGYQIEVTVEPYEKSLNSYSRALMTMGEESGTAVTYVGSKEDLEELVSRVAEADLGVPETMSPLADWKHPIQSFKGYRTALKKAHDVEDSFLTSTVESTYTDDFNREATAVKVMFGHEE